MKLKLVLAGLIWEFFLQFFCLNLFKTMKGGVKNQWSLELGFVTSNKWKFNSHYITLHCLLFGVLNKAKRDSHKTHTHTHTHTHSHTHTHKQCIWVMASKSGLVEVSLVRFTRLAKYTKPGQNLIFHQAEIWGMNILR